MALRRIIINKVNPISPGFDLTALLPRSTLDRGPSLFRRDLLCLVCVCVSLAISDAPLHHLENFFGFWVLPDCRLSEG